MSERDNSAKIADCKIDLIWVEELSHRDGLPGVLSHWHKRFVVIVVGFGVLF
jgi:hypothetical protein